MKKKLSFFEKKKNIPWTNLPMAPVIINSFYMYIKYGFYMLIGMLGGYTRTIFINTNTDCMFVNNHRKILSRNRFLIVYNLCVNFAHIVMVLLSMIKFDESNWTYQIIVTLLIDDRTVYVYMKNMKHLGFVIIRLLSIKNKTSFILLAQVKCGIWNISVA